MVMMQIPISLVQGDTAQWDDDAFVDDNGTQYKSSTHTLTYAIRGAAKLDLVATANGTGWRTTLSAANSATLTAGQYRWAAIITATGVRLTIASGELTVQTDLFAQNAGYDPRTTAQKALADAEAALATFSSTKGKIKSYQIGTRAMTFSTITEILECVSYWRVRVANEKHQQDLANGLGDSKNLYVRFR